MLQTFLSEAFKLFLLPIPGLTLPNGKCVTFLEVVLAAILASIGIALIRYAFGLGGGGDSPRTSSTNNPKISKERKGDEF